MCEAHPGPWGEKMYNTRNSKLKTILVFGNPGCDCDSLAVGIMPEMQKMFPDITFIHCDALDELQEYGRKPIIIDVAEGIAKIEIISDFDKLEAAPIFTGHDLDLAYMLKLMKKAKMIDSAAIIAIPNHYGKKKAIDEMKLMKGRIEELIP
ncbi:hypothetical protein COX84_07100 [Candidatus Micrarchaeota archaeon CG_4_10_14_0_2_um_filter_49_7]|nr:MAG: hypothetical protein COX84_07100 [Candidatus Micrarchaeota archaeon CG_4_10_14_0_2_um_filter_49_7]